MSVVGPSLMDWPNRIRTTFPIVLGGIAVGAVVVPTLTVRAAVRATRGGGPSLAAVVGVTASAGGVVAAGRLARRRFIRKTRDAARVIDPGFLEPPASPRVSTGPGSLVGPDDVGREGARYVGTATTNDDVRFVTGCDAVAEPIRIFVGLDAALSVEERVELAMAELRRTGAFDRAFLVVQAPAGTGYANATPVDVVELLSRGDCASVAVGYGLLPSFLSLDRVEIARQTQRALFEAVAEECASRSRCPRVLLYGESLGAKVQQAALPGGIPDLDLFGIDAALWVGTPGGRDYDDAHGAFGPVAVTLDHPEQIAEVLTKNPQPRVWFLEHDGDPVVRFRTDLVYRRPAWLDPAHGRGVPPTMSWRPGITWAQVLVDTVFATDVTPGDFQSSGHDYRADLGAVSTEAFGLAAPHGLEHPDWVFDWPERLEIRLRELEVRRAERVGGSLGDERREAPESTSP
jgi:uncharacterized membrane protein